jgi:DNA-binding NarL/FixJ family response regulator
MPALDIWILIADDREILRRRLKTLLASRPGREVCAEAAAGRGAVALSVQHRPDTVVMDMSMPARTVGSYAEETQPLSSGGKALSLDFR